MGNLKAGVTYIYERADGVVYAREEGDDPKNRFAIGWEWDPKSKRLSTPESKLWEDIRETAKTNATLQAELDRVKLLYYLIKKEESEQVQWHPV